MEIEAIFFFVSLGLDPALPFFATARKLWKLDSKDA
jgi:hypothetical protein